MHADEGLVEHGGAADKLLLRGRETDGCGVDVLPHRTARARAALAAQREDSDVRPLDRFERLVEITLVRACKIVAVGVNHFAFGEAGFERFGQGADRGECPMKGGFVNFPIGVLAVDGGAGVGGIGAALRNETRHGVLIAERAFVHAEIGVAAEIAARRGSVIADDGDLFNGL